MNNILIDHDLKLKDYKKDLLNIFKNNNYTQGPYNSRFVKELKKLLNVKYLHLTSSATTGLSICLEVLGIKKGDHVAVADYSWISTAHVIENIGAKPVFIDVNKETFNMCDLDLQKKLSKKIKAIIFVHAFGNPTNLNKINRIAKKNKIPVIEDAACALGSKINSRFVGNSQNLCCFSLHQRKILTTGEGGLIATNNFRLSKIINNLLSLGTFKIKGKNFFDFKNSGYNYRLSEIQCLLGLKQVKNLKKKILFRNKIYNDYKKKFKKYNLKSQLISNTNTSNIQSCVFVLPKKIWHLN